MPTRKEFIRLGGSFALAGRGLPRSLILLSLVAVCSCSAWAFRPPVDSRDGVTLAFEGFDEKTDTPALCVA